MMLSFIDKEKQRLGDFKTLQSYQKIHFSVMGRMGIMFKPTDKKQKFKISREANKYISRFYRER